MDLDRKSRIKLVLIKHVRCCKDKKVEGVTDPAERGGEGEVYLVMRESPTQLKEGVRVRYTW